MQYRDDDGHKDADPAAAGLEDTKNHHEDRLIGAGL